MLPPVNALPNSQISYQDQRPGQEPASAEQTNARAGQTALSGGLDQTASVAGRLNILILSGRERMAENLAMVADLVGAMIGVNRRKGESTASFSARLAEALAALPPAERQQLEARLAQTLNGIQLRMLLAAFGDPTGPDAAKLSILIELNRMKEGDRAASSVVTSYQQNAGDPLPEAATDPHEAPVAESDADTAETVAATDSAAVDLDEVASTGTADTATSDVQAETRDAAGPEAKAEPDAGEQVAASKDRSAGGGEADAKEQMPDDKLHHRAPVAPETGRLMASAGTVDARALQKILRDVFAPSAEPAELPEADKTTPIQTKAEAPRSQEGETGKADAASRPVPVGRDAGISGKSFELPKTAAAPAAPGDRVAATPTLQVLKGWREVADLANVHLPAPEGGEGLSAEQRSMMADALRAVTTPLKPEEAAAGTERAAGAQSMAHHPESAQEAADLATRSEPAMRHASSFPEALLGHWQLIEEHAALQRPVTAPLAHAAFTPVNYFVEDADESEQDSEPGRERQSHQGGAHSDEGQDGEDRESGAGQHEADAGHSDAPFEMDAETKEPDAAEHVPSSAPDRPRRAPVAHLSDSDRANALYWRMAGWS